MREFLEDRLQDVRYAVRMMRKSPGFSTVAILSLALGIGANTAIFTLVNAVLLKMLPVKDPKQLYMIGGVSGARTNTIWNYPDFAAFREHNKGFSGVIAYGSPGAEGFSMDGPAGPQTEVAQGVFVSGNYFDVLGVDSAAGRLFNIEDDRKPGAAPYVVLSHDFWRRRFATDPQVIGKGVRVNGYPFTVIGVSRAGFTGVEVGVAPDFFIPAMMRTEVTGNRNWNNRHNWWLMVMGRLKPGASVAQLEGELTAINKNQEEQDRRSRSEAERRFVNTASPIKLLPGAQGYSTLRNRLSQPLIVLMSVVGVVLLIACANVANLLLARAAGRQQEIAVRLAVGSSRMRLVWQLLSESVLLGVLGGAAGLFVAFFGARALVQMMPTSGWSVLAIDTTPDFRLLGFTLGVSLLTGIIFGLAPAFGAARTELVPALRQETRSTGTRGGMRLRKGLVVLQVALSLLLLIGAGLFVRSLSNLRTFDAGFRRENLLFVSIDPSRNGYKGQRLRDYYEQLRARAEKLPGVRTAVLAQITPLAGSRWNNNVSIPGYQWKQGERRYVDMNTVGPRFFETMGIPIVLGRDFRPEDSPAYSPDPPAVPPRPGAGPSADELAGPHVAIINESMAKRFFANQNPIGMRLSFTEQYQAEGSFEIIGVVKDARYFGLRNDTEPMVYRPIWRTGASSKSLCIRTAGDPQRLTEAVRREAHAIDSTAPVLRTRTMEQQVDNNILQEKLVATLSGFFGSLALLLASVGLYGVMAHSVTRRTREIGIRMALGAERPTVLWLVLKDALLMVAIGAVIGIPAAMALTKFTTTFLYGIAPRDPVSMVLATLVLVAIATLASYLPARRASRMDPNVALRYE